MASYKYAVFWISGKADQKTIVAAEFDNEIEAKMHYNSLCNTSRILTFGDAIDKSSY